LFVRHGHLDWIQDGACCLLFHRAGAAVPELRDVSCRIVDGGRISAAVLSVDAGRCLTPVDAVLRQRVAIVASDAVVAREALLVEQRASERHLLRIGRLRCGDATHRLEAAEKPRIDLIGQGPIRSRRRRIQNGSRRLLQIDRRALPLAGRKHDQ
jgi:hypothetical protein